MPALSRRIGTLGLLAALAAAGPAAAQAPPADNTPPPDAGSSAYKKVLRSTVWIVSDRGRDGVATGSGSLVDRGRRLVLTNYHVVGDQRRVTVYFPAYANGKAIPEKRFYQDRKARLGIPGEVVELDKAADLALVRVDRVPDGVPALAPAADSPEPGQSIHSIGNPGRSGALWVYTAGRVRQVYNKKWKVELDGRPVTFEAKVVETDSPTNPGDSGGPLVNDKGELVGVTQGGAVGAQLLSTFVDVSEVRKLLNRRSVTALRTSEAAADAPKPGGRAAAVAGKDDGKFFGEDAWKKYREAADRLFKEKKTDLLVETFEAPPKFDAEKVKTPADREKFFKELALERVKAEKLTGVYVVASKKPPYLYVEVHEPTGAPNPDLGPKVRAALLGAFKESKFDEGLAKAVQLVLDARGLGEKK